MIIRYLHFESQVFCYVVQSDHVDEQDDAKKTYLEVLDTHLK